MTWNLGVLLQKEQSCEKYITVKWIIYGKENELCVLVLVVARTCLGRV